VAEPLGDPDTLGRVAANRDVLARIAAGAIRARKADAWNPGGWVMRTHPDFTELIERSAPDDVRVVLGMTTLVDGRDRIYAVGYGMSLVWLRLPSGPAYDDAIAGSEAVPVEGLPGWLQVDGWRVDLGRWVRASQSLTREFVPPDA
jgi:hypothetical protein